ncbi:MAG: Gfo/Idh/MocA family oxidoreductase [Actinobacteria bacterium]|nr:Gfo/Idh/MocA family oxidoreductase [Actinomycetota bacterium]
MSPRVALVGYGSAGRGIHAPLLAAAGVPPAVVVTADAGRAAQVAADLPDALVVPDLGAALATGPDLVVVASPSGVHALNALACLEAGVPVVVDKPLAVDGRQAADVVDRAAALGVPMTVFQNRRLDAENLTLARLLADGALGEVHRFERRWERWRPVPKDRWRENAPAAEGGGMRLDLGPHLVAVALLLFGPAVAVYAETAAWTTRAEDEAFLALEHASGVRSHLTASSVAGAPGPRTRVLGSAGAYVVTGFEAEAHAFGGFDDAPGCTGWLVAGEDRTPVPTAPGGHGDFYPAVLAALAAPDAAARQAGMPVDPRDAVATARVLDAARESAAQRRVVGLG